MSDTAVDEMFKYLSDIDLSMLTTPMVRNLGSRGGRYQRCPRKRSRVCVP